LLAGCERADSMVVNPHKWLFTPIDCSALYVRDPATLKRAFSLVPEYLRTGEDDATNYMDWGVQLGRRFRALKLWMVIRSFGQEGLAARIREHIRLAHAVARAWTPTPTSSDWRRPL
jgi:aromatic-L-amino-acid decarboxylase